MKTLWTVIVTTVLLSAAVFAQNPPNPVMIKNITTWDDNVSVDLYRNWVTRDVDNGVMYFQVWEGPSYHRIYRTDGTDAGTYLFADQAFDGLWSFRYINGIGYFFATEAIAGPEPWRSDGAPGGTYVLADLTRGPTGTYGPLDFTPLNGKVYFAYYKPNKQGTSWTCYLIETDGTQRGTSSVTSVPWKPGSNLSVLGNELIIETYDLWTSDGTSTGTSELMDVCASWPAQHCTSVWPYPSFAEPYQTNSWEPLIVNGIYYNRLVDEQFGDELWRSDGTPAGTYRLTDINPGVGSSWPCMLTYMDGYIYFAAYAPEIGMELWRTDGIPGHEELVADIHPTGSSEPFWITAASTASGTRLFFSADDGANGRELWVSDGDPQGSTYPLEICPGSAGSDPNYRRMWLDYANGINGVMCADPKYATKLFAMNNKVYFAANDGTTGFELWESDGIGVQQVVDINPAGDSHPHYITELNGKILFFAGTPMYGYEWFSYDPTQPVNFTTNTPPVASFTATPDNGLAPLQVAFDGSASYDPDQGGSIVSYEWDFGDGNTGTGVTAMHTYLGAGTFTATLTVTDNDNGIDDASIPITVTSTGGSAIFVDQQSVTRISLPGGRTAGQSTMTVKDNTGVVQGAVVFASYTGPTSGTVSGTTDGSGVVTVETVSTKKDLNLEWCFFVDDIQLSGYTFNDQMGVPDYCESGAPTPKKSLLPPASCLLHPAYPNPFGSGSATGAAATQIRYDLREPAHVCLRAYDALGREVRTLLDASRPAGSYAVQFDAGVLASGTYFVRLTSPAGIQTVRVVLQK